MCIVFTFDVLNFSELTLPASQICMYERWHIAPDYWQTTTGSRSATADAHVLVIFPFT